jgi:Ca-activated chloride channel family protein
VKLAAKLAVKLSALLALWALLLLRVPARAEAGTLIPRDRQAPDPAILSLEEMSVDITIDNGDAHISMVQIFLNHTSHIEEGTYRFSLPTGSSVSDFAVWDSVVRIPAVILERKRAEQIYDQARLQAIDPGLLEPGDRDHTSPLNTAVFTARITPIPAYGTKRLELEYHQRLTASDFQQFFALPLKPDAGEHQAAHHFRLHFTLRSAHDVGDLQMPSKLFPMKKAPMWPSMKTSPPPGSSYRPRRTRSTPSPFATPTRRCRTPARA